MNAQSTKPRISLVLGVWVCKYRRWDGSGATPMLAYRELRKVHREATLPSHLLQRGWQ